MQTFRKYNRVSVFNYCNNDEINYTIDKERKISMSPILGGLFVFTMRVADMSLDTLRLLFVMRGKKFLAGLIGATQAAIFILAVSAVLKGPLNVWNVLGYSLGFGTGIILGMVAEERLAIGYRMFRIFSAQHGHEIADALRDAGHAATEFHAHGKDGLVAIINCAVARKDIQVVQKIVEQIDSGAFIMVDEVTPLRRGYFRH
jgi:uncharacterized protein YebE (UPF0316 family)